MDNVRIAYDRSELSGIKRAFKAMDAEAIDQAKQASAEIAEMLKEKIIRKAQTRQIAGASARRIAEGARVAKSSKIGELSFGFASQKYSGGATTQQLWPGMEFGSNRFKQSLVCCSDILSLNARVFAGGNLPSSSLAISQHITSTLLASGSNSYHSRSSKTSL